MQRVTSTVAASTLRLESWVSNVAYKLRQLHAIERRRGQSE